MLSILVRERRKRRRGKIKKKILEALEKMVVEGGEGKEESLAAILHKKIGGGKVVEFSDMFREIDCLRKGPDNPLNNLARHIWNTANHLDKEEYFDQRKRLIH